MTKASLAGSLAWKHPIYMYIYTHTLYLQNHLYIMIKGYYVQDNASMSWNGNERDTFKEDLCHIWREHEYITCVNIVRKLPLTSVAVTKHEEDSRVHLQRRGRMSWGQKAEACPEGSLQTHLHEGALFPRQACHCQNWLETTCEGSKRKWSYVLGLAMNMPIVSTPMMQPANEGREGVS